MSEDLKDPQDLSRDEMVSALLQTLYIIYDSGGISAGRSLRSSLLEPARSLLDSAPIHHDIAYGRKCLDIARQELFQTQAVSLFNFEILSDMLDSQIIVLLIAELLYYYSYDLNQDDYHNSFEKRLVQATLRLLPVPSHFNWHFLDRKGYRDCLVREARHRERIILSRLSKEYWLVNGVEHGIDPSW